MVPLERDLPHFARPRRSAPQAGFTLIEVMAAATVLVLGVVGAASSIINSLQCARDARDAELAAHDLAGAVELLWGWSYDQVQSAYPDMQPIARYAGLHLANEQVFVHYPVPNGDPLEMQVTITYSDLNGRTVSSTAALLRTK